MKKRTVLIGPMGGTDKMYYAPPLGIYRLRSYLRSHGLECDCIDPTIQEIPDLSQYDIIGYSVLGWSVDRSIEHANSLNLRDDQTVTYGGYEATFNYMPLIDKTNHGRVAITLGEAENALLHLATSDSIDAHPGIVWARDGQITSITPGSPLNGTQFADVTLNMEYEDIPYETYWRRNEERMGENFDPKESRVIRLYLKNRCGFTCSFCSSANFHVEATGEKPPVLTINAENVTDLLVRLVKSFPDVRTFFFQDDEIFAPKTFIRDLLEEIVSRPELKDIEFICQGRLDAIHPTLLPLMEQAKFRTVILGLENFNQEILTELAPGKLVGYKRYTEQIGKLLDFSLVPFINIILSTPNAKMDGIIQNLDRCLIELERGCELGMNLYTNNWAGSDMAKNKTYISEGFNFLPLDQSVRKILKDTELYYDRFRSILIEKYGAVNLKSSNRSLVFLLIMNLWLDREDAADRCISILQKKDLIPALDENTQASEINRLIRDVMEVLPKTEKPVMDTAWVA
jgi:radical SAM superfamily enzyme YgiQ (UPF0313 family)